MTHTRNDRPGVVLTKDAHRGVRLEKPQVGDFGRVLINLNWSQPEQTSGFFQQMFGSKPSPIDLDLGCLYTLKDGRKGAVQALGNAFGSFESAPFVQLSGDDRTGTSTEGEFLYLNGAHWSEIDRLLIYAFIYDGTPKWSTAKATVRVDAPNQSPIMVLLNGESAQQSMCAIALLENQHGAIQATKVEQYFAGHQEMDRHFHWGLPWTPGTKS